MKKSKINMLVHKYELFKIEPNKSITNMFTRFTDIIYFLKSLGKDYTNSELIQKNSQISTKELGAKCHCHPGG